MTRQNPLAPDALTRVLELLDQRTGVRFEHRSVEPLGGTWAPVSRVALNRELVIDGRGVGSSVVVKTRRVDDGGGRAWVGGHHLANEEIATACDPRSRSSSPSAFWNGRPQPS